MPSQGSELPRIPQDWAKKSKFRPPLRLPGRARTKTVDPEAGFERMFGICRAVCGTTGNSPPTPHLS